MQHARTDFRSYVSLLKKVVFPCIGMLSMQVWVWSENHAPSWNFPIGWCWRLHINDWGCWLINPIVMYTSLSLACGMLFNAFSKAVWPSMLLAGTCTLHSSDSVFSLQAFHTRGESRVITMLSVCLLVSTFEPLHWFSWNLIWKLWCW